MKVLIADDSAVVRRSLTKALTKWGYEVIEVCDGVQAWKILQEDYAPRLVILDWLMPGMDGIEVCRRVKNSDDLPFTYVVMLTSRDAEQDMVAGLAAGADEYLTKTVEPAILRSRLVAAARIVQIVPPKEWTRPVVQGYDIKRLLGKGAFATVWEAVQESTGRCLALKIIRADLATDETLDRFAREIQIMQKMDHPNIARIHDSKLDTKQCFYTMELIDGWTLEKFVKEEEPTALRRITLFSQVCNGLEHAHQQGVVHRDLKPSNIMVTREYQAKLVDFGLGKTMFRSEAEEQAEESLASFAVGSPMFMAPEQARGENDKLDGRTDVYALGVICYVFLVGRHPRDISNKDRWQTIREIAKGQIHVPSDYVAGFDIDLEQIIMLALEHDPANRYQSAAEFGKALRRFVRRRIKLRKEKNKE